MTVLTHDNQVGGRVGWVYALLSASAFGLSGALGRGLMDAGWSAAAAVAVRILVGGAVLAPLAVAQLRGRWHLVRRSLPLIGVYAAVPVAGCQLAYFSAVARIPVGTALLIEYTAPLAVVGWMWLRHGQRPTTLTAVGAAIGTAGLLLVLDLAGGRTDAVGVAWALLAMVGAAFYFVLSSRDHGGLPGTALAAGGLLVGGLLLLLAGVAGVVPLGATTLPVTFVGATVAWWVPVLALGVVSAAGAYGFGIAATRRLGARLASFVALSEVLAALGAAWLLLGQAPGLVQLLGGVLIIGGVVAVRRGEPAVTSTTARPCARLTSTQTAPRV